MAKSASPAGSGAMTTAQPRAASGPPVQREAAPALADPQTEALVNLILAAPRKTGARLSTQGEAQTEAVVNSILEPHLKAGVRRSAQGEAQTEAVVNSILEAGLKTGAPPSRGPQAQPKAYRVIKLGIDVHADRYVVVRQIDGATPQPAQGFSPEAFLDWAKRQTGLAEQVYTCYEAGPFGYALHRRLAALGVTNYVVRPRDWDEYGQKVKTDKRDARQLVLNLDRYLGGNKKAFSVVRVPTEAEEQARSRSRQREALQREKQRLAAQGRSHALYYGARLRGPWWEERPWQKQVALPPIVSELLQPLRRLIEAVDKELQALTRTLEAAAPQGLPAGLGKLTYEVLEREVGDWKRFGNRRQVASYTGMCPREDSSDRRRFQGSITRHGNPRVRAVVVEASWRLMLFQPQYKPVAKWRPILINPKTTSSKRKQIAVAVGRQFSVDWWRVRTGRCKAEDLGLTVQPRSVAQAPSPPAKGAEAVQKRKAARAANSSAQKA